MRRLARLFVLLLPAGLQAQQAGERQLHEYGYRIVGRSVGQ